MSTAVAAEAFVPVIALLPEAALVVFADGVIQLANAQAAEIFGCPAAQLPGRNLAEFAPQQADTIAGFLRMCSRSNKLMPGAITLVGKQERPVPFRCEGGLLSPASGGAPASLLLRMVSKEAAVNRFVALNLRIGELGKEIGRRQRAEAALRQQRELLLVTLSSIGDAVIATDSAGLVRFMNPVAVAQVGWTEAEASGRHLDEVFVILNEKTRAPVESPVARVLREGAVVGLANHTILIAKDGSERPIDDSGAPIRDANGNLLGVVLVFRDITERRMRERESAEEARRKDEFLAMLAHELRNPLAVLGSGMHVLRLSQGEGLAGVDAAALVQVSQAMERQMWQLTRLVDDLLDVSRMTSGKIILKKATISLRAAIDHAVESVRPALQARDTQLSVTLPAQPLTIEADVARLSQVFGNLLTNAAKFSEPGARIALIAEDAGGQAVVRVRDPGIGIAPQMLQSVFELFTQADESLARSHGGLGVGLTIAKLITELHGGSVKACSEGLGRGSEFVVRLPLAPAAVEGTMGAGTAMAKEAVPRKILVVDDNADAAASLATLLRLWKHEVCTAHDGQAALRLCERFRPDVVLLDVGLPGIDGYEVARRLRGRPEGAPSLIVAITGYGREADRLRALQAGFDRHLTKPVAPEALQELMK